MRGLDEKCPACHPKNQAEDKVEMSVDLISPIVAHEATNYVKAMIGDKKKTSVAKVDLTAKKKRPVSIFARSRDSSKQTQKTCSSGLC